MRPNQFEDTVPVSREQIRSARYPGFSDLPRLARSALLYVLRFRLAVLPVHWRQASGKCSCARGDCASPAKHPLTLHGCLDASLDTDVIRNWWGRWPYANVGIATGRISRIFVIDLDVTLLHDGIESMAALEAENGALPATPRSLTSRGVHIWVRLPAGVKVPSSSSVIAPGVDIRGEGGYVLAPPSLHISGGQYTWEWQARVDEIPIANAPDWLLRLILNPPSASSRNINSNSPSNFPRVDYAQLAAGVHHGSRDRELFRYACSLRHQGCSRGFVERVLMEVASRCKPPVPARVARAKVRSAWSYR